MDSRNNDNQTEETIPLKQRKIDDDVQRRLNAWHRQSQKWNFIHYGAGVISVFSSVTAAAIATFEPTVWQIVLGGTAAFCTTVITFFKTANKATVPRRAWRVLEAARLQYLNKREYPYRGVIDALLEGEKIMQAQDPE